MRQHGFKSLTVLNTQHWHKALGNTQVPNKKMVNYLVEAVQWLTTSTTTYIFTDSKWKIFYTTWHVFLTRLTDTVKKNGMGVEADLLDKDISVLFCFTWVETGSSKLFTRRLLITEQEPKLQSLWLDLIYITICRRKPK